jgi:hypothetical protein
LLLFYCVYCFCCLLSWEVYKSMQHHCISSSWPLRQYTGVLAYSGFTLSALSSLYSLYWFVLIWSDISIAFFATGTRIWYPLHFYLVCRKLSTLLVRHQYTCGPVEWWRLTKLRRALMSCFVVVVHFLH